MSTRSGLARTTTTIGGWESVMVILTIHIIILLRGRGEQHSPARGQEAPLPKQLGTEQLEEG